MIIALRCEFVGAVGRRWGGVKLGRGVWLSIFLSDEYNYYLSPTVWAYGTQRPEPSAWAAWAHSQRLCRVQACPYTMNFTVINTRTSVSAVVGLRSVFCL